MHGQRLGDKLAAQHVGQPLLVGAQAADSAGAMNAACVACATDVARAAAGAPLLNQLAFVPDGKAHVGPHQGVAAHRLDAVRQFGGVGL